MYALKVKGLNKSYEKFQLKDVNIELELGYIMGFIGSNGAGKTTTLKSILNMIHVESGDISILGQNFKEHEVELKQNIGYTFGGTDFYMKKKIKNITNMVKRFYHNWDDVVYENYLRKFKLDPDKKVIELSEGMKVKYALTLALSHGAKLLLLDEPTSGLDPVARDGLLELFQELVEDGSRSILFSTHITTDLEKCADFITYINNGKIIDAATKDDFIGKYYLVQGPLDKVHVLEEAMVAHKTNAFGFTGLVERKKFRETEGVEYAVPTLEEIMIYYAKKEDQDAGFTI